ncbi:hypothetical protein [Rhizobium sp. FKL33]|uniref:hypothetical protein n=1 Tax=Rhizobium sp. FKL33 TaxID=2562307 RepID=UPI00197DDD75|nr:hypothetical protein [Rhizobium sp. FKL33]
MQLKTIAAILLMTTAAAHAEPPKPDAKALISPEVIKEVQGWLQTEIVQLSVKARNKNGGDLDQTGIDELDKSWRAEREADDQPLIAATMSSPLSIYLSRIQGRSLGLYAEIFVMDEHGLNVGQSSITSDFWQGDEDKFQKTFDVGNDALFIDEPEWDDEFKIWRSQASMTLSDKDGGGKIGAVTIEFNLTELARRRGVGG